MDDIYINQVWDDDDPLLIKSRVEGVDALVDTDQKFIFPFEQVKSQFSTVDEIIEEFNSDIIVVFVILPFCEEVFTLIFSSEFPKLWKYLSISS